MTSVNLTHHAPIHCRAAPTRAGFRFQPNLFTCDADLAIRNAAARAFHNGKSYAEWKEGVERQLDAYVEANLQPLAPGQWPATAEGASMRRRRWRRKSICHVSHLVCARPAAEEKARLAEFKEELGTIIKSCLYHDINALVVHVTLTGKEYAGISRECTSCLRLSTH